MFSHNSQYEDALSFSRFDSNHFLSPQSAHQFELEGLVWQSAEHYYQYSKFNDASSQITRAYAAKVQVAPTVEQAYKLGNTWWRRKRSDFKAIRKMLMTRALYSKAIQNTDIKTALLATGDQLILENSAYEHYWGIGRDQRGHNHMGLIWMDIRAKLQAQELAELKNVSASSPISKAAG